MYLIMQVPWDDLRYLFGEIMYGGHITDDWDRRLCRTYLTEYMKPELVSAYVYLCNVTQHGGKKHNHSALNGIMWVPLKVYPKQ